MGWLSWAFRSCERLARRPPPPCSRYPSRTLTTHGWYTTTSFQLPALASASRSSFLGDCGIVHVSEPLCPSASVHALSKFVSLNQSLSWILPFTCWSRFHSHSRIYPHVSPLLFEQRNASSYQSDNWSYCVTIVAGCEYTARTTYTRSHPLPFHIHCEHTVGVLRVDICDYG